MAALGSAVQATNVELVSVIETARERRDGFNVKIEKAEKEKVFLESEINKLQAQHNKVNEELQKLVNKRDKLNDLIDTTERSYKNIVEEAKELLASVKENSIHTEIESSK